MKRTPSHGLLSVKDDLFKSDDYTETDLISLQKYNEGLFKKPLKMIFGYFEASYYLVDDEEGKTREIHLLSDKPFSFTEIKVLRERMLVAFGGQFKVFKVYQEPDGEQDADGWIRLRNDMDDDGSGENKSYGINRRIGLIYTFKSNRYGKDVNFSEIKKRRKIMKQRQVSHQDVVDKILLVAKKLARIKNFASYDLDELKVRNKDGFKEMYIKLKSNDFRISEVFENQEINQKISRKLNIDRIVINQESKPINEKE